MKPLFGKLLGAAKPLLGQAAGGLTSAGGPGPAFAPLRLPATEPAKVFAPLKPPVVQPKAAEPLAAAPQAKPAAPSEPQGNEEPSLGVIWAWKPWSFSATVIRVIPGSEGERMGLSTGDILLGLDGHSLVRVFDLRKLGFKVGQRCLLEVSIRGQAMTKECVLAPMTAMEGMKPTDEDRELAERIV